MGLFNFDNTLDWVGKNESDGEIFYGYNNGEGRNMKLVERQIDLIKKIIDDLSKVIERDESISDVNELKTPKIDELRLPDLFYRVTSDSAIALKTLTIQQHLSSKKPEKQITSCF